jgi:hypothetical protein
MVGEGVRVFLRAAEWSAGRRRILAYTWEMAR